MYVESILSCMKKSKEFPPPRARCERAIRLTRARSERAASARTAWLGVYRYKKLALTAIYNIYIGLFEHKNCIFQEMLGVGEVSADVGGMYRC